MVEFEFWTEPTLYARASDQTPLKKLGLLKFLIRTRAIRRALRMAERTLRPVAVKYDWQRRRKWARDASAVTLRSFGNE